MDSLHPSIRQIKSSLWLCDNIFFRGFRHTMQQAQAGMAGMGISQPGVPPPVPSAPSGGGSLEQWIAETMAQPLSFAVSDPETTGTYYKKVGSI